MANAKDYLFRAVTGLHRRIFLATDGKLLGSLSGMPVVALTTTGRRSGRDRTTMLTSPAQVGEDVVLVASYGGDDRHPAWYLNLSANPEVTIQMQGRKREMRARTASEAEKQELWPRITAAYDGYSGYQKRTDRNIPVVILEPAA